MNIVKLQACVPAFLLDEALLSSCPAGHDQLVNMFITLEPHGIHVLGSKFAYLFILTLFTVQILVTR